MNYKIKEYLINKRKIDSTLLEYLYSSSILTFDDSKVSINMKDLDGNNVWVQERYIDFVKINGTKLKSKTKAGWNVWYFYRELNFDNPIIIVEWEIDRLSIASFSNVIWLQWVANLKKLVLWLQIKWVNKIYLLVDNDDSADIAINKMIESDEIDLNWVYDSRLYLWDHNDLNDFIISWEKINLVDIYKTWLCLQDYLDDNIDWNKFLVWKPKWVSVDHNEFAKYVKDKHDLSAADGSLFAYDDGIWNTISKQLVEKLLIHDMEKLLTSHIGLIRNGDRKQILEFLLIHAEDKEMKKVLNTNSIDEINLSDWILDVNTFELREYTKLDYKFCKLDYKFDLLSRNNLIPVKWLEFLAQILWWWEDKDSIISFLQEYIGLLFVPSTKYEKGLLLYWAWANGKGVLLDLIQYIVWSENVANVGLHEINKEQNIYLLFGKLLNIDTDMQQGVQLDSSIIKKIVSWEPVVGKVVYQKPISFTPYARLLLATNELPYLKTLDNSIKRRFVFLNLKQSFVWKEDLNLKDKLKFERDAIFVWAIEWLRRLIKRWNFNIPLELKKEIEKYIHEADSVEQFLESWILKSGEWLFIWNQLLYSLYTEFCKWSGFKPLWSVKLWHRLVAKWYFRHSTWQTRGIKGLSSVEYSSTL